MNVPRGCADWGVERDHTAQEGEGELKDEEKGHRSNESRRRRKEKREQRRYE